MIGIVTGTPLGEALAHRLREDGREVASGTDAAALREIGRAPLIVVDAPPFKLRELGRALGDVTDGAHLLAHTVRGLVGGLGAIEVLKQETPCLRVGVLGGPLSPGDLIAGRPTAAVVASRHPEVVEQFAAVLSTAKLRVYRGRDPLGVELASTLPDLVALGWGLSAALGFGATTRAVLLVRAVRELSRLITALGGDAIVAGSTASGLAGLGDMLVRGGDPESPAFKYGTELAASKPVTASPAVAAVIENALAIRALARQHRVAVHIFVGLADLIDGKLAASDLVGRLMALPVLDD
jgi:glycerol-3-phosphate dehydrogenase (NAD(P)+)